MFEPRIGLAWDVTGKGTTVVHSGFNISYYLPTAAEFFNPTTLQNTPTAFNLIAGTTTRNAGGTINLGNVSVATPAKWAVNTPIFASLVGQTASCSNTGSLQDCRCRSAPDRRRILSLELRHPARVYKQHDARMFLTSAITASTCWILSTSTSRFPGANNGAQENARRPYTPEWPVSLFLEHPPCSPIGNSPTTTGCKLL